MWWLAWQPRHQPRTAGDIPPGRRIYLVAFFGVSAVVALITLLVTGYRVFQYLLGDVSGGSLLDRIRAPLGLLVAAGLVAGYHFALWRHDRTLLAAAAPARRRTIDQVTLVSGYPPGAIDVRALARGIADATGGARVTAWLRADDGGAGLPPSSALAPASPPAQPDDVIQQVMAALDDVAAPHVLVIVGPGSRLEVVPLAAPPPDMPG